MADDKATHNSATTLAARLAIALAQGLLIYALIKARADTPVFGLDEAIWRRVLETLRLFAIFAPLPLLFGMGNLPPARLAIWSVLAAVAVFFFGWFAAPSAWSGGPVSAWLFALIVIYIAHEFVQAAFDDGRRIATYETYFDRSWRHAFQAVMSIGFVIAFWIVISLGAMMFRLIGLEIVPRAIFSDFFRAVASPVAFALGLHLTDTDSGLTRGARQIGLALLSWLAILMTLILAAFLAALPLTGLEPLWDTRRATVLLLNAAATMILLVNAAYQAGDPPKNAVMRAVVRFSALPLAGVVALAALGLFLRVDQYGFTPARVLAGAELLIVAVYAAGYLVAAFRPGAWLAFIRPVNIVAAMFVAAILTALMTPLMDPARVAVADQVARLDRGIVEPDDFDFGFLADARAGRWGETALEKLAARSGSARDDRIALLAENPGARSRFGVEETFNDRRSALLLVGEGEIPDAALLPTGSADPVSDCVASMKAFAESRRLEEENARRRERLGRRVTETAAQADARRRAATQPQTAPDPDEGRCAARLIDLDLDGDDDLLILANNDWGGAVNASAILNRGENWRFAGSTRAADADNPDLSQAAHAFFGDRAHRRSVFERLAVAAHPWRDVIAGGARVRVEMAPATRPLRDDAIEALDNAATPDAARVVAPAYDARALCINVCFGKSLNVLPDGAALYAVITVRSGGGVELALFDAASGAYLARGEGRAGDYDAGGEFADIKARNAHEKRENRRIANGLETAQALLGDLVVDDSRLSFSYADEAETSEPAFGR
ncbi:MAG: DUF4153 domain-containing protein [Parvularculaceae bacterium]|nr:DUF4153 domain-containing protein [Parvularculaceae bacterium]